MHQWLTSSLQSLSLCTLPTAQTSPSSVVTPTAQQAREAPLLLLLLATTSLITLTPTMTTTSSAKSSTLLVVCWRAWSEATSTRSDQWSPFTSFKMGEMYLRRRTKHYQQDIAQTRGHIGHNRMRENKQQNMEKSLSIDILTNWIRVFFLFLFLFLFLLDSLGFLELMWWLFISIWRWILSFLSWFPFPLCNTFINKYRRVLSTHKCRSFLILHVHAIKFPIYVTWTSSLRWKL